jgi:hypothetical protein
LREIDEIEALGPFRGFKLQHFHESFLDLRKGCSERREGRELSCCFESWRVEVGTGFQLISDSHFCTIKINITGLNK